MPPFVSVTTIILSHAKPIMVCARLSCCPHTCNMAPSFRGKACLHVASTHFRSLLVPTRHNHLQAVYLWLFILTVQLFFMIIYPVAIAPLFNKFVPLAAGSLR